MGCFEKAPSSEVVDVSATCSSRSGSCGVSGLKYLAPILCVFAVFSPASLAQWVSQPLPPDISLLLSVDFSSAQTGVSGGYSMRGGFSGRAVYTSNGGATWELAQLPDSSRALVAAQMFGNGLGYFAGAYNTSGGLRTDSPMLKTVHKGRSASSARAEYFQRIGMDGADAYSGLFLRTTDEGRTWSTWGVLPESTYYLTALSFLNPDSGFVATSTTHEVGRAGILKTTNGGATWDRLTIPDSVVSLRSIQFKEDLGFAAGYQPVDTIYSGVILRTTDAGAHWEKTSFPQVDNFTGVFVANTDTAFAAGVTATEDPVVYRTTNGGADWLPLMLSTTGKLLQGVAFAAGGTTGMVFGSTTMLPLAVYASTTTDGGLTWTPATLPDDTTDLLLADGIFLDERTAYLVGGSPPGYAVVFHTTNGGVTTVRGSDGRAPSQFTLLQNFPNPFNPSSTIRYGLPFRSHVTLIVFNALGAHVATLVQGEQEAGYHEVRFDGRNHASGVYFYRMQAGAYFETKRLLLVK